MICWIDLETTGLVPRTHCILEIACVITDDNLVEQRRFHAVPFTVVARAISDGRPAHTHDVNDYVRKMHTDNGLWQDSALNGRDGLDIMRELRSFLYAAYEENHGQRLVLGGNSVHFDRAFLTEWVAPFYPDMLNVLHYRNLDVSSIVGLAARCNPEMNAACEAANPPGPHRAMPDILRSISMARFYADALSPAA